MPTATEFFYKLVGRRSAFVDHPDLVNYTKRIICLANSRKLSGRCIAGREISGSRVGDWIRPVSGRVNEEISLYDRRLEDGSEPVLLDVLEIPMTEHRPHACQVENHLIADEYYWTKVDEFPRSSLRSLCEAPPTLWINGYRSYSGINDRIPEDEAANLTSSLVLIEPDQLVLCVERGLRKLQVRAAFSFRRRTYNLTVTDPDIERNFLRQGEGRYKYDRPAVACVSIGEPFEGYRYKLVASIIDL